MSKKQFVRSKSFYEVPSFIEDEILELYSEFTNGEDFYLSELVQFLESLKIPVCFFQDISNCVNYFYSHIYSKEDVVLNVDNHKQNITLNLVKSYTITTSINNLDDVVDIIDVDKLLKNCSRLVKFRNTYRLILNTWTLFVESADKNAVDDKDSIVSHRLTLPHLQKIKNDLGLEDSLSDSSLIDMLGACSTVGPNDEIVNYDWNKLKSGKYITIRDFSEIMGQLGELD